MRAVLMALGLSLAAGAACAQDSGASATATSQVAGALTESGIKSVVATSAKPVTTAATASGVVGSVAMVGGAASMETGVAASQVGQASAGGPLKVDDRVVVAPDPAPKVPYAAQAPRSK